MTPASSPNHVTLVGTLTADAGFYVTRTGRPKVTFRMAVARGTADRSADFFTIVCLSQRFVSLASVLAKGTLVTVTGRLQSRDVPGGRTVTEVRAEAVIIGHYSSPRTESEQGEDD